MYTQPRVLSAMRPSGTLHLGHFFGPLENWKKIQYEYDCYFMVADIQSLSYEPDKSLNLNNFIYDMVISWLAAGIDPSQATIFIQSKIPEHFELAALLAAITPLSWLERVPNYKDRIGELQHTDHNTYGFLGYSLMLSACILAYNSNFVAISEAQLANIEFTREVARRFNHIYGREEGFEERAFDAIKKLGLKKAEVYEQMLIKYQQEGNEEALERARFLLKDAHNLSHGDRERLFAFLENKGKVIFNEPQVLNEKNTRIIGIDGQKMANSLNNIIGLREARVDIQRKIKAMPTDPARIRRTDCGNPNNCPVWSLHQIYSSQEVKNWAEHGCLSASIGCLDCKQPLIDAISQQQEALSFKAKPYVEDPTLVKKIITEGCARAREVASTTLHGIKQAMSINY